MSMTVTVRNVEQILLVEVAGKIDGQSAPELERQVLPAITPSGKVLLDVSRVPYMSSAGFRTLLLLYRSVQARRGRLALVGLADEIRETMEMTGFLKFFLLGGSADEGVALLQAGEVAHAQAT